MSTTPNEKAHCKINIDFNGGITVEAPTVSEVTQLLETALTVRQHKPLQEAIR